MASERASAFEDDGDIDLSGFAPKAQRDKGVPSDKVKALAQQSKFRERDMPQPTGEGARPPRRYRTGRNRQINIKASDATIQSLYTIADTQGWVLGETLEHALAALERELAKR